MKKYTGKQHFIETFLGEVNSMYDALKTMISQPNIQIVHLEGFQAGVQKITTSATEIQRISTAYIASIDSELDFLRHETRFLQSSMIYNTDYQRLRYLIDGKETNAEKLFKLLGRTSALALAHDILTQDYIPTRGTRALRIEQELALLEIAYKVVNGKVKQRLR